MPSATLTQATWGQTGRPAGSRVRTLADDILAAFHQACDLRDFAVAQRLLASAETALKTPVASPPGSRRRAIDSLVAAHERLWSLKHQNDMP